MSDVFISYSRRDGEFVQRLNTALVDENRVVWVDWQGIPAGEDWWMEIMHGIENAETFVAVISENWLTSHICHRELEYAMENNKRIIPLVHQAIDGDVEKRIKGDWMDKPYENMARTNWDYLRHLNWIFVDSDEAFETGFAKLLATIDEDLPHLKAHTRYQRRALEWKRSNENPSFLLLGDDLTFAEKWLQTANEENKTPHPTELQKRYIEHSRKLEDEEVNRERAREQRVQQFRFASIVLGIVGSIAIIATIIAIPTSINAQNNNATSVAQISTASNILVTSTSVAEQVATSNANLANAQEQVIIAGETLTPVAPTLTAVANDLVGALNAQSEAVAQVTTIAEQVSTSDANLADAVEAQEEAITQVMIAGETLTPVPATLTAVATALSGALDAQNQAFAQVTTIADQVATSDANLVEAQNQIAIADSTLTPVPPTLTAVATALSGAIDAQNQAVAQITAVAQQIATSDANLADAIETQSVAFAQVTEVAIQVATSDANLASAREAENAALAQVEIANETLTPVPVTLTAVAEVAQQTEDELTISNESSRALQNVRNGYVGEALSIMNNVVDRFPEQVNAYIERAYIYRQIGQPENAYDDYTTAIELDPERAETFNVRALVLEDLGRTEEALADFASAIELRPESSTYYANRGSYYSRIGELDLALEDLNTAIDIDPENANTYVTRAGVYKALDRDDDAIDDYTTAIELEPRDANAYNNRASSYSDRGEYELALADLNQAIELEPQQASYYNNRSFVHREFGDTDSALDDLNRAIELAPGNTSYYNNRYFLHRELGNIESALADITRVMDANPSPSSSDYLTRGLLYFDLEQYDGAIADFTQYIELNPDDPGGYDLRGAAYAEAGRYQQSLDDYNYIINDLTPEGQINVTALINQGWTYYRLDDFDSAIENYDRVLRALPDEVFALGNRGLIYLIQGRLQEAFTDYELMVETQLNDDPFPGTNIIDLAITDINEIIAESPNIGAYYMMRGYLHYMNGNRILAAADWTQADQLGTTFLSEIEALR